jgi:hypothetical protein
MSKKFLNFIAWFSGIIGLLFLLLGIFQLFFGFSLFLLGADRIGNGRLFAHTEIINYFIASISFFSITIVLFLIQIKNNLSK